MVILLWRLELKRTIKLLPAMLFEAAALLVVTVLLAFGVGRLLYQDAPMLQVTVAVVEEEDNPLTELALNYVQGMESISEVCRFVTVTEEEGFSMLREGRAAALLVLPVGMIEGILNGENLPVQVYFPEDAGIESALLKELTDAGVRMLRVAQAQIYGIYDTAAAYGALEQLSVLQAEIDQYNLAFALERLALFKEQEVSATENLSSGRYAVSSGITFFLLLLGMAAYPMMQPDSAVFGRQLARQGICAGFRCFGKWLCGLCSMSISFFSLFFLAKGILKAAGQDAWMPVMGIKQIAACFFILLCVTTFVFMVFQIAGSGTAAILILFLLSTVMLYFSGGFLPTVFLPEAVQRAGRFLPTTYLMQATGNLYSGKIPGKTLSMLFLFTIVFGIVSYGAAAYRDKKGAGI